LLSSILRRAKWNHVHKNMFVHVFKRDVLFIIIKHPYLALNILYAQYYDLHIWFLSLLSLLSIMVMQT